MRLHKGTINDVLKLALPAVGEMILYMMIGVFDTMMVGKYGGNIAVSSVGISSETIYTFAGIFISCGISIGITSLVARNIGAKKYDKAEEYATLGLAAAIIISIILGICYFALSGPLLKLVGAEPEVIKLGSIYMKIASFGIILNMIMNALNATLRGSGNTKTPLFASAIVNIINISLDYILIFGKLGFPALGTKGAAIATSIAQTVGFLFIVYYCYKKSSIKIKFKYLRNLNKERLKALFALSIPSSMQEGAFSISRLLCNFFIVSLGTIAFAANQITTTIESISFMPGWGFAVAATTLVGQKIGEGNDKKAKEYAYYSIALGTLIMTLCSILFLALPKTLISLFISQSENEVITLGSYCLMIAAIEQPFMAVSMIVGGALKGAGDTKTPFKVSLFTNWVIRLPLMFIAVYLLHLSVTYVWIITSIQWALDGILIYYAFRKKYDYISEEHC
ncbi:MATE family efflux transporter [Clostridium fallax]|uniref:Probable multidrug resistance protein NorM n=1 Tax=Clostridium fallax TaxID=1533 RepID=A0A1M4T9G1_9CLOT|nr:MATE family efflux transporter [Clostridium fallax]SHE41136.1 putative efflux protein, MATE family [Clostridium fallax]SQB22663.1 MATE efflux family protein [Clostridium fallax]